MHPIENLYDQKNSNPASSPGGTFSTTDRNRETTTSKMVTISPPLSPDPGFIRNPIQEMMTKSDDGT